MEDNQWLYIEVYNAQKGYLKLTPKPLTQKNIPFTRKKGTFAQ